MSEPIPGRMKLILLFILGSMVVMFADGLMFDNYNSRPSMAMMHMEMKPVIYNDPAAPNLEDYWEPFDIVPGKDADMHTPLPYEIIEENGERIKLFRITMRNALIEIRPGVQVPMFTFEGQVPAPTIRVSEGDKVRIILYNNGTEIHTIHWHGINNISHKMDGVPDVTQEPVNPGESFVYEFTAGPSGTKIYHCHVESPHHITMGMFGALIVDPSPVNGGPNDGNPFDHDPSREYTLIFNEFDTSHQHISYPGEMMAMGPDSSLPWLITPGRKFMMPFMPEFNEYLINGKSFPSTEPLVVKQGDIVRVRLINLGMQMHSIHIHGHEFTVTHRDGFKLPASFKVDTLGINPGERYDVWFEANNPGIWMVHDHALLSTMTNGYDPGGIMTIIAYEGVTDEVLDHFLERVRRYNENIEHMNDEHGSLTPTSEIGGAMDMGGMDMGGGGGGH